MSLVTEIFVLFIIYNELSVTSATYIKLKRSHRTISLLQKTEKDSGPLINISMDFDASSLPPEGNLMHSKQAPKQCYNICDCRQIIACWTLLMLHQLYTLSGIAKHSVLTSSGDLIVCTTICIYLCICWL
jgi:hypothetical protein